MVGRFFDSLLKPYGREWLKPEAMKRHGSGNLMKWARCYNRWRYGKRARIHERAWRDERDTLLRENGGDPAMLPRIRLNDGWHIDTSRTLPHLDALLGEMHEIVRERGGVKHSDVQQPFLRNLIFPGDIEKYPSMLNFITSSEILATVMDYMKTVPVLSKTRPPGIRFMESNVKLDPDGMGPAARQPALPPRSPRQPARLRAGGHRGYHAGNGPLAFSPPPPSRSAWRRRWAPGKKGVPIASPTSRSMAWSIRRKPWCSRARKGVCFSSIRAFASTTGAGVRGRRVSN